MAIERFPVEEGSILLFARAVGDPNPIYSDIDYTAESELAGILAPPTYVRVGAQFDPDYALRPKLNEPWLGSGRTPSGVPGSDRTTEGVRLHAEEHFEYFRSVRPGDILSAHTREGASWQKRGSSGTLHFFENITEYRDQSGDLVVTERSVGVAMEGSGADVRVGSGEA